MSGEAETKPAEKTLGGVPENMVFYCAGTLMGFSLSQKHRFDEQERKLLKMASDALRAAAELMFAPGGPLSDTKICSPEHPMPKGAPGRWMHTNAKEVGDQRNGWPGGDLVTMRCLDCGTEWTMELPQ